LLNGTVVKWFGLKKILKIFFWIRFSKLGFDVLDEGFMKDEIPLKMHSQSFTMEHQWISSWFGRIMKKVSYEEKKFYIVDRSPYSSVFYTRGKGKLFVPLIDELARELREEANIYIFTVCLQVEKDILWKRICERLEREPQRKKYGEDSREWMEKIHDLYSNFNWDLTLPNNEKRESFEKLISFITGALEKKKILCK